MLIILAGPSRTGKSTILKKLFSEDERLAFSVSHTTRPPRDGEVDGREYHFVDDATFEAMKKNDEFLETADIYGKKYGTPRAWGLLNNQ